MRLLTLYEQEQHAHLLNEVDVLSKAGGVSPDVMGLAALSLCALERWAEAEDAAEKAAKIQPDTAWLHGALATALAGRGKLAAALVAQQQAVRLAPGDPGFAAGLARYQRLAGRPGEAVRIARQALVIAPRHIGALNELGLALSASGDGEGALAHFRMAQEVDPAAGEAWLHEGVLHLEAGAQDQARRALREALHRRPWWAEVENRLVQTVTSDSGLVARTLRHVLSLGRVTPVGWLMIAFLYYLLFRLLEFAWKALPVLLPVGQVVLAVTLTCLLGGLVTGRLIRFALQKGWPR